MHVQHNYTLLCPLSSGLWPSPLLIHSEVGLGQTSLCSGDSKEEGSLLPLSPFPLGELGNHSKFTGASPSLPILEDPIETERPS